MLFIHAVNPYGFAWRRRVNENNVELNRSFLLEGETHEGCPEATRSEQKIELMHFPIIPLMSERKDVCWKCSVRPVPDGDRGWLRMA